MPDEHIAEESPDQREEESNTTQPLTNRRTWLKGLAVSGIGLAGAGGLASISTAQDGEIPAPFCGDAVEGPSDPPGQAGQCIDCVRDVCTNEPIAVALFTDLSGNCFTLAAEEIPDNAEYITLKAGQYCFRGEVPADPSGDVTWCIEQADGQPPMLPEISNATLYTCGDENPPAVDNVTASCDEVVITTSNIPNGDTLDVTVDFADGTSQTDEDVPVQNNQATVPLPGESNPINVRVVYQDNLILFDAGVMADPPCEDEPAVTDVDVTCAQITIQTANIDAGEELDVTVFFTDDSSEPFTPAVDANGVAEVGLPGDRDPERLVVEYQGQVLFDQLVAASDAPCTAPPECPPGLNIKFKFKNGMWCPLRHDGGNAVDPSVFSVEGDRKQVTICGPFPFAVSYATRKKRDDDCRYKKDEKKGRKKGKKKDDKRHGRKRADCKKQEPVLAEPVNSGFCATIPNQRDGKRKKSKICWFRLFCPENNGNNDVME
ncbi:hypothetical protein [Halocatena pleomorpha]|uniref:Uncharacterized protein n=1 Tax=Halocatena pleomorpha TaxID=1785090 RepID=A0A3P3R6U6_9EURY|nr:hypothetical protein [Halocatena pleomorpha]RRJ29166.1 hypothetical protein EIK79_13590 [Halocatena pleomorpha]